MEYPQNLEKWGDRYEGKEQCVSIEGEGKWNGIKQAFAHSSFIEIYKLHFLPTIDGFTLFFFPKLKSARRISRELSYP